MLTTPSLLIAQGAPATQPAVLKPGDNLVVENIPPVPRRLRKKPTSMESSAPQGCRTGTRRSEKCL